MVDVQRAINRLGAAHIKTFPGGHLGFCAFALESGFRWVELKYETWLDQRAELTRTAHKVREFAQTHRLSLSVHAAYDDPVNIGSPDQQTREASRRAYLESLEYAIRVGAQYLTVHGGHLLPDQYSRIAMEDLKARSVDMLASLAQRASSEGVTVCVENRHCFTLDKFRYPVGPADLRACLSGIGGKASMTIDSGHARSVVGTSLTAYVREAGPQDVALTHLHDNDGSADQHRVPGDGSIDFVDFVRAWSAEAWGFPLLLELGRPSDYVRARGRMVSWLENLQP